MIRLKFACLIISLTFISTAFASNVGMVIKKRGQAILYTNPSSIFSAKSNTLFEGKYYKMVKVKRGTKIKNGDILKTGSKSKVRVVFKNGDQFNVGEGTAYTVTWAQDTKIKKKTSTIRLLHGSLRGIISPKGPRNTMKVRTKNAVMGVRGTDFHFLQQGTSGHSHISVLRGKVQVQDLKQKHKRVNVQQGFSANVISDLKKSKAPMQKKIVISQTSKPELVMIQKHSTIKRSDDKLVSNEIKQEIESLEKKAIEVTLEDIKTHQPTIYEDLKKRKITSLASLNTTVVKKVYKTAPVKPAKISIEELELNLDENAYDKYFTAE